MLSTLLNGLSLGALYALIALGYTMVYGIAKMLNFAHGDVIMVGAYTIQIAITSSLASVLNPFIALLISLVISIIVCTLSGIIIEKIAYRPLRGASPLAVLITAIGVSYFLQGSAQLLFGAAPISITMPQFGNIKLGDTVLELKYIYMLICGVLIMLALTLFVGKTRVGRAMIAVSEDRGAAQLMGINVNKIITLTFAIGSALASFASLFYLLDTPSVDPLLGAMPGIKAFAAAVIGGIGSIPGAMLGGMLLGVVESFCKSSSIGSYTLAVEFGMLVLILLIRPIGILGKKRRVRV